MLFGVGVGWIVFFLEIFSMGGRDVCRYCVMVVLKFRINERLF